MKVTIIGTGYVGRVSEACLAEVGNHVMCLDVDPKQIQLLIDGGIPIFEPGLQEMVRHKAAAGRLQFTTEIAKAIDFGTVQILAATTYDTKDCFIMSPFVISAKKRTRT